MATSQAGSEGANMETIEDSKTNKERLAATGVEDISNCNDDAKSQPPPYSTLDQTDNALINSEFSESMEEYTGVGCCHPATRTHRYFVLVFMCFLAFGSYYCYDNPAALTKQIKTDLNISQTEYTAFYAAYSYPNVILCFFGGFLLDTVFGIRLGAIIFALIICVGQVIFAGGALLDNFYLMVLGRFVFGLGGESLAVAQNTYAVLWFKGKELNTVFGVQLSIARLGSVANMNSMPYLYKYIQNFYKGTSGLGIALMIAGVFCIFSLLCGVILAYFDKRAERILRRENNATSEVIQIKDVLHFPLQFWLLCLICAFYYAAIFPFISVAGIYLQNQYNMTEEESSTVTSISYTVSAIVSPLCGMLCDVTGLNLIWTLVATIISAGCHLAFSYLPVNLVHPGVIMGVLGFGFSLLACAFWPMVTLVIPEHQLGTAYGVMQAVQNLGLAVVVETAGVLQDSYGFQWTELYFLMWMTLSIVVTLVLLLHNIATKGLLNPPLYRRNLCGQRGEDDDREYLVNHD